MFRKAARHVIHPEASCEQDTEGADSPGSTNLAKTSNFAAFVPSLTESTDVHPAGGENVTELCVV